MAVRTRALAMVAVALCVDDGEERGRRPGWRRWRSGRRTQDVAAMREAKTVRAPSQTA